MSRDAVLLSTSSSDANSVTPRLESDSAMWLRIINPRASDCISVTCPHGDVHLTVTSIDVDILTLLMIAQ